MFEFSQPWRETSAGHPPNGLPASLSPKRYSPRSGDSGRSVENLSAVSREERIGLPSNVTSHSATDDAARDLQSSLLVPSLCLSVR